MLLKLVLYLRAWLALSTFAALILATIALAEEGGSRQLYSQIAGVYLGETKTDARASSKLNPKIPDSFTASDTWRFPQPYRGVLLEVQFRGSRVVKLSGTGCYLAPIGRWIEAGEEIHSLLNSLALGPPSSIKFKEASKEYRWHLRNQLTCVEYRPAPDSDLTENRSQTLTINVKSDLIEHVSLELDDSDSKVSTDPSLGL